MTGFLPLLKKEIMEQWRTYRFLVVGSVFLMFGITTPLMLKYLPEILQFAGEDIGVVFPPPTAVQSLAEYAATIAQIGVLVAVLVAMGAIANELRRGTAVITLSKPVSYAAFVNAKFIAISLTFLVSLVVASAVCFVYTIGLIEKTGVMGFAGMNLLTGVFLLFALAVTLLFSAVFRSSVAAGGLAIATIISLSALSAIPVIGDYLPGSLLSWGNNLLVGAGDSYWWSLGISIALTALCLALTPRLLHRKEI